MKFRAIGKTGKFRRKSCRVTAKKDGLHIGAEAIARMRGALTELVVDGLKTTVPFHLRVLDHSAFRAGDVNTRFLERLAEESTLKPAGATQP